MDSKMKHRILGVVVIAAVAILAYPFLISKNLTTEAFTLTEAPPFPDEAIQVTTDSGEEVDGSSIEATNDGNDEVITVVETDQPASTLTVEDKNTNPDRDKPHDTIDTSSQEMVIDINVPELIDPPEIPDNSTNIKQTSEKKSSGQTENLDTSDAPKSQKELSSATTSVENSDELKTASADIPSPVEASSKSTGHVYQGLSIKELPIKGQALSRREEIYKRIHGEKSQKKAEPVLPKKIKKHAKQTKKHHKKVAHAAAHAANSPKDNLVIYSKILDKRVIPAYKKMPLNENGLFSMKQKAYVIQMGSFKQKANALRLVNKLRSKGYRAFIQKYATASGDRTRVFVGPEKQRKSARVVASELHKDMKMQGIVITYKPLSV